MMSQCQWDSNRCIYVYIYIRIYIYYVYLYIHIFHLRIQYDIHPPIDKSVTCVSPWSHWIASRLQWR